MANQSSTKNSSLLFKQRQLKSRFCPYLRFQIKLITQLRKITSSKIVTAFSDKTANIHFINYAQYRNLLKDTITRDYRLAESGTVDQVPDRHRGVAITKKNSIKGKIPKYQLSNAYVTIKDHTADFPQTIKGRLVNPRKTYYPKSALVVAYEKQSQAQNQIQERQKRDREKTQPKKALSLLKSAVLPISA